MTDPDFEAAEAMLKAAEQLLRCTVFICIDPTPSPDSTQLRALQVFYPRENLLSIRKLVISGSARIGPVLPEVAPEFANAALGTSGLTWHLEPPSESYIAQAGIGAV